MGVTKKATAKSILELVATAIHSIMRFSKIETSYFFTFLCTKCRSIHAKQNIAIFGYSLEHTNIHQWHNTDSGVGQTMETVFDVRPTLVVAKCTLPKHTMAILRPFWSQCRAHGCNNPLLLYHFPKTQHSKHTPSTRGIEEMQNVKTH